MVKNINAIYLKCVAKFISMLACMFWAFPSSADCPSVWHKYSSVIDKKVSNELMRKRPVFFVGTDGAVFNCLKIKVDSQDFNEIIFWQKSLSAIINSKNIHDNPENWPVNVCGISRGKTRNLQYATINLPYDENILESTVCQKRIFGAVDRFIKLGK